MGFWHIILGLRMGGGGAAPTGEPSVPVTGNVFNRGPSAVTVSRIGPANAVPIRPV